MPSPNKDFIFHNFINQLFLENNIMCKKLFYGKEIYFNFHDIIKYFDFFDIITKKERIKKIKTYTLLDIKSFHREPKLKKERFNNLNINYDVINFFKQKGEEKKTLFIDEKGLLQFSEIFYKKNNDFIKFVFHSLLPTIEFKNILLEEGFFKKKKNILNILFSS